MKKLNVYSSICKGKKVNFAGFILDFDAEGKTTIILESDEKELEFKEKVLSVYSNLISDKKEFLNVNSVIKENKKEIINENSEYKILKDSNIKLAKENASLKKENEELAKENASLKKENEELKKQLASKENEIDIDTELKFKSLEELKNILNDIYVEFKDEWKNLNKKEDIIQYIKTKNFIK